jgi:hypothetical protein
MRDVCYVLVWADADLHVRVNGVYATRFQAERVAAAEVGVILEWMEYRSDTPPCWFANVRSQDLPGRDPEPGCYLIAERRLIQRERM